MTEQIISLSDTEYLSMEQLCKVCHIAKRTAAYLLKSGIIPAIDTRRKTDRYIIKHSDVVAYLEAREKHPEQFGYPFRTYGQMGIYSEHTAQRIRALAEEMWKSEPELLTMQQAAALIGYRDETLYHWRIRYHVQSVKHGNKLYIPKESLLNFIMTKEFHEVERKSKTHYELIWRAYHE